MLYLNKAAKTEPLDSSNINVLPLRALPVTIVSSSLSSLPGFFFLIKGSLDPANKARLEPDGQSGP